MIYVGFISARSNQVFQVYILFVLWWELSHTTKEKQLAHISRNIMHVLWKYTSPNVWLVASLWVQCNLNYPDLFVHRLIAAILDKWNSPDNWSAYIYHLIYDIYMYLINDTYTCIQYDHGQQYSEKYSG